MGWWWCVCVCFPVCFHTVPCSLETKSYWPEKGPLHCVKCLLLCFLLLKFPGKLWYKRSRFQTVCEYKQADTLFFEHTILH